MAQMTWRTSEEQLKHVRIAAELAGRSMNDFVSLVMAAATDPDAAGDEITRVRERLARAGILAPTGPRRTGPRPDEATLAKARAAAGRGKPLSDFVNEGRG
jgi:uncharacterized protein (DUF1778 family)